MAKRSSSSNRSAVARPMAGRLGSSATVGSRKHTMPRQGSRALKLLSALATGALDITVNLAAASSSYRRVSFAIQHPDRAHITVPEIDIERILRDARERGRYAQAIREIQKRRFARLVKRDGRYVLVITEEGRRRSRAIDVAMLRIPAPKVWDGQWRIVLFDIPEERRFGRDALRRKLTELGFFKLQRSAFVLPYPCADELDAIVQYYDLASYVTFFTTESLGYQEAKALAHFRLSRKKRRRTGDRET